MLKARTWLYVGGGLALLPIGYALYRLVSKVPTAVEEGGKKIIEAVNDLGELAAEGWLFLENLAFDGDGGLSPESERALEDKFGEGYTAVECGAGLLVWPGEYEPTEWEIEAACEARAGK